MNKQRENHLLANYIRRLLEFDVDFTATRNDDGNQVTASGDGLSSALADEIQEYLREHPEVARIEGRQQISQNAGIESANIFFFDKDDKQVGAGMVWAEFRQKKEALVVTEDMLKELEATE